MKKLEKQYQLTVNEALQLWDCLKTMRVRGKFVDLLYKPYLSMKEYKFRIKTPASVILDFEVVFGKPDELCTITLCDFRSQIKQLQERQAVIEGFIQKQVKA